MNAHSWTVLDRRKFLVAGLRGAGGAWAALHWPAILQAAEHSAHMRAADAPAKLEILTADQAAEIEAAASRIIPTDESPGAREAGVIYFIDKALGTFGADNLQAYVKGLPVLQAKTQELCPGVAKFSQATPEQQDAVLKALEKDPFFDMLRMDTITGFLCDPMRGGNRGEVGWKLIGYDDSPAFSPPFGYYDRDYPGWHPPEEKAK